MGTGYFSVLSFEELVGLFLWQQGWSGSVIEHIVRFGLSVLLLAGMLYLGWQGLRMGKRAQQRVWGEEGDPPPSIIAKDEKEEDSN